MITEGQIREQLYAYLTRQISLSEFEDWLVQRSWDMHRDSDEAAQRLVAAIELRLSEYSDDHLPDNALDRELYGLLARPYVLLIADGVSIEPRWTGATASESSWVTLAASPAA